MIQGVNRGTDDSRSRESLPIVNVDRRMWSSGENGSGKWNPHPRSQLERDYELVGRAFGYADRLVVASRQMTFGAWRSTSSAISLALVIPTIMASRLWQS